MSEKLNGAKTAIYLRKSRKDRDEETIEQTLQRHEDQLLSYAEKNALTVTAIKKEVVTGDSIAVRPVMQSLLEEVEDCLYDAVLVMDIDRLGRGDMIDQGMIANTFKKTDTRILTPDKEYDLSDEYDEEFFDLSAFFARKELKMIKRRLLRGKIKSIQEGNYIGAYAPFGYDKAARTLVVNEKEKPVVEMIFDLYVNQGMGDTKIARYLESHDIPNRSGNASWDRTAIRRIIRNPVYIGKIVWNKREDRQTSKTQRSTRLLPPSQDKIYDGKHAAIIEEALFNQAQQIAKSRQVAHLKEALPLRNPLSSLLKCGACGSTMTMRSGKEKPDSLRCSRHCGGVSSSYLLVLEERLIAQLWDSLADSRLNFKYQKQQFDFEKQYCMLTNAADRIDSEMKKLEKQKIRLCELLEQGIYNAETYLIRSQVIGEKIAKTKERQKEAKERILLYGREPDQISPCLPEYLDVRNMIEACYWRLQPTEKNDFLKSILQEVVYDKEKGADQQDFTLKLMLKL